MKKIFSLLSLWLVFSVVGLAQGSGPITVKEADGSPICNNCRTFIFGNGTLTVSGNTVTIAGGGGGGGVTSVGGSFTGGLISVSGSPVTTSGTLAFTVAGTSGGIPYFSSGSTWASSPLLVANALMIGGGAGNPPATTTTGTGVITALGVNTGSAGAFVVNGGALGTPSGGTATNLTGLPLSTGVTGDLPFANFVQAGSAGFVGATGAGDYSHRTPTQVTAALDAFVGDSGSGGTKGLVPAPTTGDATKYLKGDGTWASVSASPGGSDTQLQRNNAGAFGGISGATSDGTNVTFGSGNLLATSPAFTTNQTTTNNAIGATSTDGIVLENTTAAAAGAQQYSPRIRLTGQGWKTNATAASQAVDWAIENQPVQGTANPTTNLAIRSQVNAGGYSTRAMLTSGGSLFLGTTSKTMPFGNGIYLDNGSGYGELVADGTSGGLMTMRKNGTSEWFWQLTSNNDLQFTEAGVAAAIYFLNGSNLGIGDSASVGTSGTRTLIIRTGVAPTTSPADEFQLYSADSAAGDANAFARNEAGEINRLTGLAARNSSSFAKTSDTTLANITGLTRNVEAGRAYAFTATLQTTAAATGGVKFAVSGTATATSISYEGVLVDTAVVVAQTRATALDTTVCASTTSTAGTCTIKGVIVVNAAGTLTLQFAQNASDGGASTVLVNQFMQLVPIS